ncbi:MAG: hypothetical protein VX609_03735 [Verrucomicrobiota bacterium]|nr:hypothetical protein [Verrucomicrobiota bacterium]
MPVYEFEGKVCSKTPKNLTVKIESMGHAICPLCGFINLEKKLSVFATASQSINKINFASSPCSVVPTNYGSCSLEN